MHAYASDPKATVFTAWGPNDTAATREFIVQATAEANSPDAFDMVSIWGLGFKAELGGSLAPGLWMHQGAQRVLQQTRPGVLYTDLNACNSYQNALAAAAQVKVPTIFILGERDMMTPAKSGKMLAAATPNARTIVLPGAGHMMMAEAPDELLAALQQ